MRQKTLSALSILRQCDVLLDGELISNELLLSTYARYLASTATQGKHNVGVVLHTGSICFDAICVLISAIECILFSESDTDDVISDLKEKDIVIYNGGKYIFEGKTSMAGEEFIALRGQQTGRSMPAVTYVPKGRWHLIMPYEGNSQTPGRKGIRNTGAGKKLFYTKVMGVREEEIPVLLDASVAIIMPRERANKIVNGLSISFEGENVPLLDLVTAAYYTESVRIDFRGNTGKSEPCLKFAGKISVARDNFLFHCQNKALGFMILGEEAIRSGETELQEMMERRSLRFSYAVTTVSDPQGKQLLQTYDDSTAFICSKEFLLENSLPASNSNQYTCELENQVNTIVDHSVLPIRLTGPLSPEEYTQYSRAMFSIRHNAYEGEEKDNFILLAGSIMKLLLSAPFSMDEAEKIIAENKLNIDPPLKRLDILSHLRETLSDDLRDSCDTILNVLESAYLRACEGSQKEAYIVNFLHEHKDENICIIVPKAYYKDIFTRLDSVRCCPEAQNVTITTGNRFDKAVYYDTVLVLYAVPSKKFDLFQCMTGREINVLLYDCENRLFGYRQAKAVELDKTINGRSTIPIKEVADESSPQGKDLDSTIENDARNEEELDDYITHLDLLANIKNIEYFSTPYSSGSPQSEICAIGIFETGETVFFSKRYKAYVYNSEEEEVKEVAASELTEGDMIIFTRKSHVDSENRDIVDYILGKLVSERKLSDEILKQYRMSKCWKESLIRYKTDNGLTDKQIAARMISNGVSVQEITIRGWLDEDSHTVGPRSFDSIQQIGYLTENEELFDHAEEYFEACRSIRRIREDILKKIGAAIVDKYRGKKPVPGTVESEIFERIESKAQILRLENLILTEKTVPSALANIPLDNREGE